MIVTFVCGIVKNKKYSLFILIIFIALLHLVNKNLFNLAYMLPYYVIGYYFAFAKKNITEPIQERYVGRVIIIFTILQCYWSGEYNVWNAGVYVLEDPSRKIPIICFRFLIGIIGIVVIKYFCNACYSIIPHKYRSFLIKTGQNTFLIYIIQSLLIEKGVLYLVKWLKEINGKNVFVLNIKLLGYFIAPLISIIVIQFILLICCIIKRNKCLNKIFCGFKISTLSVKFLNN